MNANDEKCEMRIKYYSNHDLSVGLFLERAEVLTETFDVNKECDINDAIELYNTIEILNSGVKLMKWSEQKAESLRKKSWLFHPIVSAFFGNINEQNVEKMLDEVDLTYTDDFWVLFSKYKLYERISEKCFYKLLQHRFAIQHILVHKDLVEHYDTILADYIRSTDSCAKLILNHYLSDCKDGYHFPKSLKLVDYEQILNQYVSSDLANPNYLKLIENAQSSKDFPVDDKLRLAARKAYDLRLEKLAGQATPTEMAVSVKFDDLPEPKAIQQKGPFQYELAYDIKWIDDNLDYPTLLNNFLYLFEYIDLFWRSNLVSVRSKISALEKLIGVHGNKDYPKGAVFEELEMMSSVQMYAYYEVLKKRNVWLEDIFKWYFEEYILEEFGAGGFTFNPPSRNTSYVEKCRTLASEMDGVFKQFQMFIEDGAINRELFEMSSKPVSFSSLKSGIQWKYAYRQSEELQREEFCLFSDQSHLTYTEQYGSTYHCLYDLIASETLQISDFQEYQKNDIRWLIDRGTIILDSEGVLEADRNRTALLKDLYDHDVICLQYCKSIKGLVDRLLKSGDLRCGNTLFSEPESNYLNYKLNKSEFSNGQDLRNMYSHSTYPKDEQTQLRDYMELMKVMVIVIMKIQNDLLLRECDQKGETISFG